ncbi:hypothetical protein LSH36_107g08065 [Paralvinella palmiformis]|uniref:Uncharacterized protein n=1 Tax=Paralvinella palmiformis TaxID=53620 RepID=A0AAD9K070_9ANNE|nr:hypothetical protein LSH36_107g08065 [Paralvinella palmiformis]
MKAAFGPSTSSPDHRQRPASRSWGFGPVVRTCVHRTGELLRWSSALCLVGLVVCAWSMNRPERTVDGGIGSGGRISHGGASGGRSPGRHTTRLEVLRVDPKQIRQDIVVNPKYTVGAMSKLDYPVDQDVVTYLWQFWLKE